jgi:probable phosphoglycerate mutase
VPAAARLVIVRHGESTWNAEARLQGQQDPPLSALGREQARRLRPALAQLRPDGVVCSDLRRARETAALAGFADAEPDPRWRELDIGAWSAQPAAAVPQDELAAFRRGAFCPPGAERWEEVQARVGAAADDLAARGGLWLVFAHGGPARACAAHVTGASLLAFAGPANGSLTIVELAPERALLAYNRADEDGLPAPHEPGGTTGPPA